MRRWPLPPARTKPNSNACAASHAVPVAVLCCCTLGPAVRIMFLTSGAKGTRTPDPLLANNRQTVHPRPYPQVTVLPRPSKAARVHTGCGTSVLYTYKPQREGLDVRAPLVPGQRPRVGCSVRQFNEAPRVIGRHVTEPEEHRRRARGQELLQRCGRAPGCWPLRPPVARYLIAVRPVRRARHNCRAEAVEDRPAPGSGVHMGAIHGRPGGLGTVWRQPATEAGLLVLNQPVDPLAGPDSSRPRPPGSSSGLTRPAPSRLPAPNSPLGCGPFR